MSRAKAFDPDVALDRAVELFWQLGYEGSSMAKLLEFMGISRQSLYDTYGDKHSLFLAAIDRYRDNLHVHLAQLVAAQPTPLASIRAVFAWVEEAVLDTPERRSCLLSNSALERGQHDPELRVRVAEHLAQVEAVFHSLVVSGQELGELDSNHDPRAVARVLTNSIHGLGILARSGTPTPMLRETITTTLSLLEA